MLTYFIATERRDVARLRTRDALIDHLEEGIAYTKSAITTQALAWLSKRAIGSKYAVLPTRFLTAAGEVILILDPRLREWLANAGDDLLSDITTEWNQPGVSDVVELLSDLAAVCLEARAHEMEVYVVSYPGTDEGEA